MSCSQQRYESAGTMTLQHDDRLWDAVLGFDRSRLMPTARWPFDTMVRQATNHAVATVVSASIMVEPTAIDSLLSASACMSRAAEPHLGLRRRRMWLAVVNLQHHSFTNKMFTVSTWSGQAQVPPPLAHLKIKVYCRRKRSTPFGHCVPNETQEGFVSAIFRDRLLRPASMSLPDTCLLRILKYTGATAPNRS